MLDDGSMLKSWFARSGSTQNLAQHFGKVKRAGRMPALQGIRGRRPLDFAHAVDTTRRGVHLKECIQAGSNVNKCRNTIPAVRSGKRSGETSRYGDRASRSRSTGESDEIMLMARMKFLIQERPK